MSSIYRDGDKTEVVLVLYKGMVERYDAHRNIRVIVHDYDVDGVDPNLLYEDEDGDSYQVLTLEA